VSGRARPADAAFAAAACIVLAGYNNLAGVRPWHRRWYPAVNGLAATAALAAATASGLTSSDLGLRRDRLSAGLRCGSAAAAPVVAAFGVAALTPATRPLLNDQRIAGLDRRQLAYQVLLRIPVGTVAWEEIAFRGVLQAALRRVMDEPGATAVGSAVFGLWHIRPTAEALAVNGLAAGRGARVAAVAGVVVGTAGAGAVLSLLRERSGSLVAPVLLHLAANCSGPLASALARPAGRDQPGDDLADLGRGDLSLVVIGAQTHRVQHRGPGGAARLQRGDDRVGPARDHLRLPLPAAVDVAEQPLRAGGRAGPMPSSRPRPTTISRVAVWAISLIRCEDTNTVRPSAASALSRLRIHSTPSGSRPFTGSSKTTTFGSPSNAEATPRRWSTQGAAASSRSRVPEI
jgi:uncharacterized protein